MKKIYQTHGTCAQLIDIEVDDEKVTNVKFFGGCQGNQSGISSLVVGMKIEDVIKKLEGITCGYKTTSCPDQLAKALKQIKNDNKI